MMHFDPINFVISMTVILVAIGLHEYAHCKFADLAGDPTPRMYGRVTLNLFKHLDPVGTVVMVVTSLLGFGFGWGKPAPFDDRKMRNPRVDLFVSVIAGPLSNVAQALVYAALFRLVHPGLSGYLSLFLMAGVFINIELALFNLIPIFPLDGHWLVGLLLPAKERVQWFRFQRRMGFIGVILLVLYLNTSNNILDRVLLTVSWKLIGIPV